MNKSQPGYVTWSDKTGLIAHFEAYGNDGFKNSKCCNSPMAEVMATTIFTCFTLVPYLLDHLL